MVNVPTAIAATPQVQAAYPGVAVVCLPTMIGPAVALAATAERIWHEQHAVWSTASRSAVRTHPHIAAYRAFAARLGLSLIGSRRRSKR